MVFFKKLITNIMFFEILLMKSKGSYISLQFTKQEKNPNLFGTNFTLEDFREIYIEPKYSSIIEVGNPPQKVDLIFSMDNYGISLIEDANCSLNNTFNKKLSSSINVTHIYDSKFSFSYYSNKPIVVTDTLYLPFYDSNSNKISKIELNEYPYVYLTKNPDRDIFENKEFVKEEGKAYMLYGPKLYCSWRDEICENLPFYLKSKDIINSQIFNVIYNKNNSEEKKSYDFEIIIGKEPHYISPDIYDLNKLKYLNALTYAGEMNWIIQFHEVFYFPESFKLNINNNIDDLNQISLDTNLDDKKIYSYDDRGQMAFDLDVILCPKFYFFKINSTYFGNHTDKCKIQRTEKKHSVFVCDKDFNTENFPSIYFYHRDLNYTFILTQKELFKVIGDKKYFLIVYDLFRPTFWMFGKIFLAKYTFNFDMDKRIGFYIIGNKDNQNTNIQKKQNNYILLINLIWLGVVLIILIVIFFVVGKKVFHKIRKKRANELEDNYEYNAKVDNNESIDENKLYNNSEKLVLN